MGQELLRPAKGARDVARGVRRVTLALCAMLALASTAMAPGGSAQQTPTQPITTFACGGGVITVFGPKVLVGQGYLAFDALWYAELYRWTTSGWLYVADSYIFGAEAQGDDASAGQPTGWAGPSWFWREGLQWVRSTWFRGLSGSYYAVRNVVVEGGLQNTAWATTDEAMSYCYLP